MEKMDRRRLVSTGMGLAACGLAGRGRAEEAAGRTTQTYFMMVFSNPVAGRETEYNKWYDSRHIFDVTAVPGFVSGQRLVLNEPQMFPGVTVRMPKYLALFKIASDDLEGVMAEVGRRVQSGQTVISPDYDKTTADSYVYRLLGPELARTDPQPAGLVGPNPVLYNHIVFTVPAAGKEDGFDLWYDKVHSPEMLARPGFLTARRMVLARPGRGPVAPTQKAAMFKVELPEGMPVYSPPAPDAPKHVPSAFLDPIQTRGYTYRAIGPVINGPAALPG